MPLILQLELLAIIKRKNEIKKKVVEPVKMCFEEIKNICVGCDENQYYTSNAFFESFYKKSGKDNK